VVICFTIPVFTTITRLLAKNRGVSVVIIKEEI